MSTLSPKRSFFSALLALSICLPVYGETIAVRLADVDSEDRGRKLLGQARHVVEQVSGLELLPVRGGPKRPGCEDAACWQALGKEGGGSLNLFFLIKGGLATVVLVDDAAGTVSKPRSAELGAEAESTLKSLVEQTLPPFARKGWGGLLISPEGEAVVKLDGKTITVSKDRPLPVTASVHSVDVLFSGGAAVLQRLHVPEGGRLLLPISPLDNLESTAPRGTSNERLRLASYALWTTGALALAASLLAGAASRGEASHQATCQGADRTCETYESAQAHHDKALAYARTGNVLLGTGALLSLTGAGVFTFDFVRSGGAR